MRKTNKSYTLALCVDYALITTDSESTKAIDLAHDDIYATKWLHDQGYKARIEGNTLVISKDYGWTKVDTRYVIVPNVDFYDYRANRNYSACIAAAKRFAMIHTIAIVNKINSGR